MLLPVLLTNFIEIRNDILHEVLRIGLLSLLLSILLSDNLLASPLSLQHSLTGSPLGLVLFSGSGLSEAFIRVQFGH